LYWYFAGQPAGDVKKLADWVMTKDGQAVVENVGYYPLPESVISKYSGSPAKETKAKSKKAGGM
jgi:hypothetical protein